MVRNVIVLCEFGWRLVPLIHAGIFPEIHAVRGADFAGDFEREAVPFLHYGHGVIFEAQLADLHDDGPGVGAGNHYLVVGVQLARLHEKFAHAEFGEVTHPLGYVTLDFGGR